MLSLAMVFSCSKMECGAGFEDRQKSVHNAAHCFDVFASLRQGDWDYWLQDNESNWLHVSCAHV